MARESVKKILKEGTLVKIHRLDDEIGIIVNKLQWDAQGEICYVVFVKGKNVKAYEEGFTILGEI